MHVPHPAPAPWRRSRRAARRKLRLLKLRARQRRGSSGSAASTAPAVPAAMLAPVAALPPQRPERPERTPLGARARTPLALRASLSAADVSALYDGDAASFYSHASVVDVADLNTVLPLPSTPSAPTLRLDTPAPPRQPLQPRSGARREEEMRPKTLGERVVAAAAEALDLKPSRVCAALDELPLLAALVTPTEFPVVEWLLRAAAVRAGAADAAERSLSGLALPDGAMALALAPAKAPSEEMIRAVALEIRYAGVGSSWGARCAREWGMHARVRRARARSSNFVALPLSFALGLVATVCALVRLECAVSRRVWGGSGSRTRARLPQAALAVRCGRVRFAVNVLGTAPCTVLFRRPKLVGRETADEFEDIVKEVAEIVGEFADFVVYG